MNSKGGDGLQPHEAQQLLERGTEAWCKDNCLAWCAMDCEVAWGNLVKFRSRNQCDGKRWDDRDGGYCTDYAYYNMTETMCTCGVEDPEKPHGRAQWEKCPDLKGQNWNVNLYLRHDPESRGVCQGPMPYYGRK